MPADPCPRCDRDREDCFRFRLFSWATPADASDMDPGSSVREAVEDCEAHALDWRAEALELRHQIAVINAADDENGEAADVAEAWRARVEPLIEALRVANDHADDVVDLPGLDADLDMLAAVRDLLAATKPDGAGEKEEE